MTMRLAFLIAGILMFTDTHESGATEDGTSCGAIENVAERLLCYDGIFRTPNTDMPARTNWDVSISTSPLTDEQTVVALVLSNEEISCGRSTDQRMILLVRCKENSTSLYFDTGCHMTSGHGDYGKMEMRIDTQTAISVSGAESTNNEALGLWGGAKSIPIIKKMLGGELLTVRMTPFVQNPFVVTFNIAGMQSAIAPLRKACSW